MLGMQITSLEKVRESVGLAVNERGPQELEVAAGVHGLSEIEINTFVDMAEARYRAKRMDPGWPHATASAYDCTCTYPWLVSRLMSWLHCACFDHGCF